VRLFKDGFDETCKAKEDWWIDGLLDDGPIAVDFLVLPAEGALKRAGQGDWGQEHGTTNYPGSPFFA